MRTTLLVFVLACAGTRGGSAGDDSATFSVFYPDAPATGFRATVGKRFYVKPVASCVYGNGRDARWSMTGARIETGELPPGFTIEDGAIAGVPKQAGTWSVKVKFSGVTCAGQAHDPQLVDVMITAAAKR
jgi:hypothetical protein